MGSNVIDFFKDISLQKFNEEKVEQLSKAERFCAEEILKITNSMIDEYKNIHNEEDFLDDKKIAILALYATFSAIIENSSDTNKAYQTIFANQNIFMYLFQNLKLNDPNMTFCSVNDNARLYDFLQTSVYLLKDFNKSVKIQDILSSKNIFRVFIDIMQKNYADNLNAILNLSSDDIESRVTVIKENHRKNMGKLLKSIASVIKCNGLASIDHNAGECDISEDSLEALKSIIDQKLQIYTSDASNGSSDSNEILQLLSSIEEKIKQLNTNKEEKVLDEGYLSNTASLLDDFDTFKREVIKEMDSKITDIFEEKTLQLSEVAKKVSEKTSALEKIVDNFVKQIDAFRVVSMSVEDIKPRVEVTENNVKQVINLIEEQNKNASDMIEKIKNNDI